MSPRYRSAKSCTFANFSKTYGMSAAHIMLEAEIIYREGTASESEIMKARRSKRTGACLLKRGLSANGGCLQKGAVW